VTEIRNVSDAAPFDPGVRGAGYEFADHLNYLVDLRQSPDRILAHMDRRVRSVIRRGETDGSVEVLQVSDPEGRAACYDLLVGTYRRIAVPLADRSLFEAIAEVLEPRGMARFLLGRVNGSPAATAVALTYHGRVYDWFAGNDRVFTRFKANELVTWSLMEWGAANGYETFDWGGAGSPHEPYGVRAFKAKWGGELVSYGRYLRVHAPTRLRVCSLAYAARRRMLLAGSRERERLDPAAAMAAGDESPVGDPAGAIARAVDGGRR
jgi:serine/alanine adding enzyme